MIATLNCSVCCSFHLADGVFGKKATTEPLALFDSTSGTTVSPVESLSESDLENEHLGEITQEEAEILLVKIRVAAVLNI